MEKHSNVFERFTTFENMYDGYLLARRNKRYKDEVLLYSSNLEENLIDATNHLIWKDYKVDHLREFCEYYPKKSIITAMPFANRVVNCAAYTVLWPIYTKSFYEHSYGSIKGHGPLRATEQLQHWLRIVDKKAGSPWWVGKADVAKFFFRVPFEVQLRELGRPLNDPDMMWFLETVIKADGRPMGLPLEVNDVLDCERILGIGMQVGSLISQMTGNVVLTPLDHYMKRELKTPYYIRYMDDMILLAPSKQQVWDLLGAMDDYLQEHLGLQLNNKTAVMRYDDGPEFVGKRIWPNRIKLRKSTSLQMKRHLDYVRQGYAQGKVPLEYARNVITSYLGVMKHCECNALRDRVLENYILIRDSDRCEIPIWPDI